jgi:hypothetical protein
MKHISLIVFFETLPEARQDTGWKGATVLHSLYPVCCEIPEFALAPAPGGCLWAICQMLPAPWVRQDLFLLPMWQSQAPRE